MKYLTPILSASSVSLQYSLTSYLHYSVSVTKQALLYMKIGQFNYISFWVCQGLLVLDK